MIWILLWFIITESKLNNKLPKIYAANRKLWFEIFWLCTNLTIWVTICYFSIADIHALHETCSFLPHFLSFIYMCNINIKIHIYTFSQRVNKFMYFLCKHIILPGIYPFAIGGYIISLARHTLFFYCIFFIPYFYLYTNTTLYLYIIFFQTSVTEIKVGWK